MAYLNHRARQHPASEPGQNISISTRGNSGAPAVRHCDTPRLDHICLWSACLQGGRCINIDQPCPLQEVPPSGDTFYAGPQTTKQFPWLVLHFCAPCRQVREWGGAAEGINPHFLLFSPPTPSAPNHTFVTS